MAEIELIDRVLTLSIRRLSEELGMARETVSKRLAAAHVRAYAERNGHPVYRLRDAVPALIGVSQFDEDGELDPRRMPPEKRHAHYQAELRRIDVELKTGNLLPAGLFEAEIAEQAREFTQFLGALPDTLERDAGLTPEQVEIMRERIDAKRNVFADAVLAKLQQKNGAALPLESEGK